MLKQQIVRDHSAGILTKVCEQTILNRSQLQFLARQRDPVLGNVNRKITYLNATERRVGRSSQPKNLFEGGFPPVGLRLIWSRAPSMHSAVCLVCGAPHSSGEFGRRGPLPT